MAQMLCYAVVQERMDGSESGDLLELHCGMTENEGGSHLTTVGSSPLDILVPPHGALLALIPAQLNAAADVLCDTSFPARLADRTVDGLDLVPPLLGCDLGQVSGSVHAPEATAGRQRYG